MNRLATSGALTLLIGCAKPEPPPPSTKPVAASPKPTPDPREMRGWRALTWGMTRPEAKTAVEGMGLGGITELQNNQGDLLLRFGPVDVLDASMEGTARFKSAGLISVSLFVPESEASYKEFSRLHDRLVQLLGPPHATIGEVKTMTIATETWALPQTRAELRFAGSAEKAAGNALFVTFADPRWRE